MRNLNFIGAIILLGSANVRAADFPGGRRDDLSDKGTIYSPIGKRDPFKPPSLDVLGRDVAALNPLERFSIEQLQLRAILKGLGNSRAMVEDPEGKTYIIKEGMVLGRERAKVSRILDKGVVLTERTFNYLGQESLYEKVIPLPQTQAEELGADAFPQGGKGGGRNNTPNPNIPLPFDVRNPAGAPQGFAAPFVQPGGAVPEAAAVPKAVQAPAPAAPADAKAGEAAPATSITNRNPGGLVY